MSQVAATARNIPEAAVAPFTLTLFGPMQILVAGQPIPHLRSRKAMWLLALLALRGGRPAEREWLAGTLWPDADLDRALSNLRSILSDLRVALGSESARLCSPSRHSIALNIESADIDVLAFDAAIADGALSALSQAVSRYRGALLEGCREDWVTPERTAREHECLRALEALADAALASGDWKAAVDYFQWATTVDPWRDEPRRGLMEALTRSGNTNAAMRVYQEFAQLFRDDPSAAPDTQTTALYQRLRSEMRRRAHAPAAPAPDGEKAAPVVAGYLPHPLTNLIGRQDEREEVAACLRRSRLVTLTGPGGIGKTRLALAVAGEVAPDFSGGVWLVALEALSAGAQIVGQIAATLGLTQAPGRTLLETLTAHLRSKRLLLVLDNCEHVLEASAKVAAHLLWECADLRILATSREALGLMGEAAWAVPALSSPDPAHLPPGGTALMRVLDRYEGVRLFVERAQAGQAAFELTRENAPIVAQVCARLEGVPLALELAAARVRAMTVEQLAARLDNHLGLLAGGNRTAPTRHQTLRAMLDWSYALLSVPEQIMLARLSVFAGGWTLEAAEAVCFQEESEGAQTPDLLQSLVDKSLASFDASAAGGGRYRLLEMVRQYAAERLNADEAADTVRTRHRDWFLALAARAATELRGPDQTTWVDQLEVEYDNLRAALAWCAAASDGAEPGLRLAGVLGRFWELRGYYSEGRAFLSEAIGRAASSGQTRGRAKALCVAGVLAFYQGDYAEARQLHEQGLEIYREIGDRTGVAWGLNDLGDLVGAQGDLAAARTLYTESLAIFRELDNGRGVAQLLHHLGRNTRDQGDYESARRLYEEGLAMQRMLGDQEGIAWALHHLGNLAVMQGDLAFGWSLQEEGLTIFRDLGNRQGAGWALQELGRVAVIQSDYETAIALHTESLEIFRELGNRQGVAHVLHQIGQLLSEQREYARAERMYEEGLAIFRLLGDRAGAANLLHELGAIAVRQGRFAPALALYRESIDIQKELGEGAGTPAALRGLAACLAARGDVRAAVQIWGAVEAWSENSASPFSLSDLEAYTQQLAQARAHLGADAASVWEQGRALTWDQAVEFALTAAAFPGEILSP